MPYRRKTWREKLEDNKGFPKILELRPDFPCRRALEKMGAQTGDSVVLAPASEVYDLMMQVEKSKLMTLRNLCEKLAEKHGTQYCCTLTTGIFVNVAANAATEMKKDLPYWRTIKNDGELNKKFPGGAERQKELLEREGHTIIRKGRKHIRYYVKNYEEYLVE